MKSKGPRYHLDRPNRLPSWTRVAVRHKPSGNSQGTALECFQSDFLSEHDIAGHKRTARHKAPAHFGATCLIQFVHVHRGAGVDAVFSSCMAPNNVEVPFGVKLFALTQRKPISEKSEAARLWIIFAEVASIQLAQRPEARSRCALESTK
jgi:hypothetical protein